LKIKKILISQPEPLTNKSPYFELAKKNNVQIDFRPFIQVEGVSSKEFRKSRVGILDFSAVIFTSRTPIDHYFRICKELKINIPDTMKYFCISEPTAFYLQKYIIYRKRKIFYSNNTFDDLVDLVKKHREEKFLLPISEIHKPDVPQKLDKIKIEYKKAILYRTVSSDLSDLPDINYDMVIFFSPSGVQSLLTNFPDFKQNEMKIASFGPATAKAVKEAGLRLDIQAPLPKAPSMTMALDQYLQKQNKLVKTI